MLKIFLPLFFYLYKMESIEDRYIKRILRHQDYVNNKCNDWIKLKYKIFDFLYIQYKDDIIKITKIRMFREYREAHKEDNISQYKFMNVINEYLDIMDIDYKKIPCNQYTH